MKLMDATPTLPVENILQFFLLFCVYFVFFLGYFYLMFIRIMDERITVK